MARNVYHIIVYSKQSLKTVTSCFCVELMQSASFLKGYPHFSNGLDFSGGLFTSAILATYHLTEQTFLK